MRLFALVAIRFYQRYLSPYKGFCCAYRQHTGRASCSELGYRVIRRVGVLAGLVLLRRRTYLCGVVHRRYLVAHRRPPAAQRGDCDFGCDAPGDCDLPSGKSFSRVCDYASCCDVGSCDWQRRKDRDRGPEKYVYIPPRSR